jgi:MFS transporter, DHA1 family, multidrug resistance protein
MNDLLPQPRSTAREHHGLAMMLAALSAVGPLSIDAYLPSLREIGRVFETSPVLVQQTLTAYMVPFSLMTLWHGAISDALGRRRVTLATLALFGLGSVGCMLAWNIESFLFFRAVQGMTAGAGMVIGRAIVRDVLEGDEARRLMARISLMFVLAPAAAPVLGGWLHVWFGWRSVFAFIALFTAAVWWWCWLSLPETLNPEHRQPLRAKPLVRSYGRVLRTMPFMALVVSLTFTFSAAFLYILSAPAFLMGQLHVRETGFFWMFGPITLGMLIGTVLSDRTASRLTNNQTVVGAFCITTAAALGNLLLHLLHPPGLPWSILPLAIYFIGSSLAMPSLTLMALDVFPRQRGLASSCQGFIQTGTNALTAALLAPLLWGSALSLAVGQVAMLAVGILSFLAYWFLLPERRRTGNAEAPSVSIAR